MPEFPVITKYDEMERDLVRIAAQRVADAGRSVLQLADNSDQVEAICLAILTGALGTAGGALAQKRGVKEIDAIAEARNALDLMEIARRLRTNG